MYLTIQVAVDLYTFYLLYNALNIKIMPGCKNPLNNLNNLHQRQLNQTFQIDIVEGFIKSYPVPNQSLTYQKIET
jgi:hypothetical protein